MKRVERYNNPQYTVLSYSLPSRFHISQYLNIQAMSERTVSKLPVSARARLSLLVNAHLSGFF